VNASDYDLKLEELSEAAVGRLLCAEVFDLAAFVRLRDYLSAKSELIKAEHVVSKQVVKTLLGAAHAIESSAKHVPGASENLTLANEFHFILGLVARGEARSDRQPGKPRVL
jgi:hypothetical protein